MYHEMLIAAVVSVAVTAVVYVVFIRDDDDTDTTDRRTRIADGPDEPVTREQEFRRGKVTVYYPNDEVKTYTYHSAVSSVTDDPMVLRTVEDIRVFVGHYTGMVRSSPIKSSTFTVVSVAGAERIGVEDNVGTDTFSATYTPNE